MAIDTEFGGEQTGWLLSVFPEPQGFPSQSPKTSYWEKLRVDRLFLQTLQNGTGKSVCFVVFCILCVTVYSDCSLFLICTAYSLCFSLRGLAPKLQSLKPGITNLCPSQLHILHTTELWLDVLRKFQPIPLRVKLHCDDVICSGEEASTRCIYLYEDLSLSLSLTLFYIAENREKSH